MSLMNCPECGLEVSTVAAACPHCARPINPQPVAERKIVVVDNSPTSEGFPTWALIPIGLLGVILLAVLYMLWGRNGDETANIRVNANLPGARQTTVTRQDVPAGTSSMPSSVTVPQTSAPSSQTTVPGSQTSVADAPTKGRVNIEAKVITRNGSTQAVRNERFYLLDQDVETILGAAGIQPIDGQTLTSSLGLSLVFPDQYGEFRRDALSAIKKHVKYAGQTDSAGKASVSGVEPNSYYLFGMTKVGRGFSIWNSQVSIVAGDNALTLSPQSLTEIQSPAG